MPSLAVEISKGATVCMANSRRDKSLIKKLLAPTGAVILAKDERMLDSAFLHASGMAFFFSAIEGMMDAGVKNGVSENEARQLSASAAEAAGALLLHKKAHPKELEGMVATKGGITAHGLLVLEEAQVKKAFREASGKVINESRRRRAGKA